MATKLRKQEAASPEVYDRIAEIYDKVITPLRQEQFEALRKMMDRLPNDSNVLDVGCGTGEMALIFARHFSRGKVLGIDTSGNSVEKAREKAMMAGAKNAAFQVGDAFDLKFPYGSFDAVISSQLIGWVDDKAEFVRRTAAPLRLDGMYGLIAAYVGSDSALVEAFRKVGSRKQWKKYFKGRPDFFREYGLELLDENYIKGLFGEARLYFINSQVARAEYPAKDAKEYLGIIDMFGTAYLRSIPEELKDEFRKELSEKLDEVLRGRPEEKRHLEMLAIIAVGVR